MMEYIYRLFPIVVLFGIVEIVLHILNITIPCISIDPMVYKRIRENDMQLKRYHKRHLIYGLIIIPCATIAVYAEISIMAQALLLVVIMVSSYIVGRKDKCLRA